MNYNWNKNDLIKRKKYIDKLILNASKKKINIQDLMYEKKLIDNQLEIMFGDSIKDYNKGTEKILYKDCTNLVSINTYNDFNEINNELKEIILELCKLILPLNFSNKEVSLLRLTIPDQYLVEMSYDFFEKLPTDNMAYIKNFKLFTNPKKHLLKIDTNIDFKDRTGSFYPYIYPKYKPYFFVNRENDLYDFLSLNHEISHGVWNSLDYVGCNHFNYYELSELEGTWFNYLSSVYLKRKYGEDEFKKLEYLDFKTIYNMLIDFYITSIMIKLCNQHNYINVDDFKKEFGKEFDNFIDCDNILLNPTNTNPSELLIYIYSYLIRLDLEKIFEIDQKYAFRCFESILKGENNSLEEIIRNNSISFMDDGFKNFKAKIKKYGNI